MNQPKPIQIRLPFSVPRPKKGKEPAIRVCGICRERDSRYTCPRCNVAYCSLECFRSDKHGQCSEPFYRETVLQSIKADPTAGLEEKKGMMDMLRRFEEEAADGGPEDLLRKLREEEGEEIEEDDEGLAESLAGIDLDQIDTNALFHLLPPEHRERFLKALKNPESKETRQLLELAAKAEGGDEEEAPMPDEMPWWEAPDVLDEDEEGRYADIPSLVGEEVLTGINPPEGVGMKLVYNAMAICLAYLHVLLSSRLPSLDPSYLSSQRLESDEIKTDISHLVPFLTDQKSTVRYASVREAYSAIWEALGPTLSSPVDSSLLQRLLASLPNLLHPPIDTSTPSRLFLILTDLYSLYSRPRVGPAGKKLCFYIVALRQLGRADWLRLEKEVEGEIRKLESELGDEPARDRTEQHNALLV